MGSVDLGEDIRGRLGPDVGCGGSVVLLDMVVDGSDEIAYAGEGAAAQPFLSEISEESFDHVEPGRTGRREVDMKARMLCQPLFDGGLFVCGVVVNDEMEIFVLGRPGVDEL